MTNRRKFIKQVAVAGMACSMPSILFSQQKLVQNLIWANFIHLGYNMFEDELPQKYLDENYNRGNCEEFQGYRRELIFDEEVWDILLKEMAAGGTNFVVIDLGDGIQYESHPEIAVKNAWTPAKLKIELAKMRKLGLEPIPKLNFATAHDLWLGQYGRMVSTDIYYAVCRDLINEVITLFDRPRFFHLGMDEETYSNNSRQRLAVVRHDDLYWGDFYFLIGEVMKGGSRPWIWSDYGWHHPDKFFKMMPKSVLQSNWYYGLFDLKTLNDSAKIRIKFINDLETYGYDQIPTGSNYSYPDNFEQTVDYCKKVIDPARLLGFMTVPWRPTTAPCLDRYRESIAQVARAKEKFKK